jgi:hypothetical protein
MRSARPIPRASSIKIAKAFACQFRSQEWNYLCSCRWFLHGVDSALETGGFASLQRRAEEALVAAKLRKPLFQDGVGTGAPTSIWWLSLL